MSGNQYPSDVQFAGLIQAATAAADAQERNASILGKRQRLDDDSLIDTQLRTQPDESTRNTGQLPPPRITLQSSASVLFREPTEKSKKYSRPPLGKVYTDLELAPESFLRLQNAAKSFMLDENHTDRRDVVGHKKHSSNNDVAKLRLWGCVEAFLNEDNNGEKWFGHNAGVGVPDAPPRTFFWPEDRQKITKLCMPLFRKMVTNERQRLYASETRKQDSSKGDKNRKPTSNTSQTHEEDASFPQTHDSGTLPESQPLDSSYVVHNGRSAEGPDQRDGAVTDDLTLHISVMSHDNHSSRRVARFSVQSNTLRTLSDLIAETQKHYDLGETGVGFSDGDWFLPVVKVWLPDGLARIKDDGQWMVALLSAGMVEWLDAEVRVLIEIGPTSEMIVL